ncbi:type I-E CRISPR-associated protein Cas7/Cse4/CasC [Thermoproteota archaeon]
MTSKFLQLHLLTAYPPSNLNRDDLGRPKTAIVGGEERLRISSQSLKRAWRTSDVFSNKLREHIGIRTKQIGRTIYERFLDNKVDIEKAQKWTHDIIKTFGAPKADKKEKSSKEEKAEINFDFIDTEQLVHFSPEEVQGIYSLVDTISKENLFDPNKELRVLRNNIKSVDIALFGRMLADTPEYNIEAAAQVAHAITVHKVAVEDDFFTAVDDLNKGDIDAGAGHLGETEFGAGIYYIYLCVDKGLLKENLSDDGDLANKSLASLIEASAIVSPSGKQNSFASHARASYLLCELGNQQPRSLSLAFYAPIKKKPILSEAITSLKETRKKMDEVYGPCADKIIEMDVEKGSKTLAECVRFALES